jgi:hypothetical protein
VPARTTGGAAGAPRPVLTVGPPAAVAIGAAAAGAVVLSVVPQLVLQAVSAIT